MTGSTTQVRTSCSWFRELVSDKQQTFETDQRLPEADFGQEAESPGQLHRLRSHQGAFTALPTGTRGRQATRPDAMSQEISPQSERGALVRLHLDLEPHSFNDMGMDRSGHRQIVP